MEFNLADLWERVADTVPDQRGHRLRRPPAQLRRGRRARQPARAPPRRARHRPRRSRRALPLQRHRVPRGDAGRVQAAGGADQCELPLRRGGAAVPARRRRRQGGRVPPRVRTHARSGARHAARCSPGSSWSTTSRAPHRPSGATEYESCARRPRQPVRDFGPRSPDDLYILYTGGTTGMPKGVMWRAEDIFFGAFGGGNLGEAPITSPEEIVDAPRRSHRRGLPACPFMHGTAHWMAFGTLFSGGTVVISPDRHLDPARLWRLIEHERVDVPRDRGRRLRPPAGRGASTDLDPALDVTPLTVVLSGGAMLSPSVKEAWVERLPGDVGHRRLRRRPRPGGQGQSVSAAGAPHRVGATLPRERRDDRARRRPPTGRARCGRQARPARARAARVLHGPGEDGGDVPGDRRRAVVGARRPRPHRGRRHHHRARARLGVDQHRRREGVPRGGRVGAEVERRGVRRRRRRRARRALGRARHRGRAGRGRAPLPRSSPSPSTPGPSWRRTRCRGAWCWSTRSCDRRRASPTTGGHGRPPSPPRGRRSLQV